MTIIGNHLGEKEAEQAAKKLIIERITEHGGTVSFDDFWGAKGFAYMIKGQKWGYYHVAQFDIEAEKTIEMRTELNIEKDVVRFLITKVSKHAGEPKTYADMKKEWDAMEKESKISEAEAAVAADTAKTAKKAEKTEPKAKAADPVDAALDSVISDAKTSL